MSNLKVVQPLIVEKVIAVRYKLVFSDDPSQCNICSFNNSPEDCNDSICGGGHFEEIKNEIYKQ